MYLKVVAACVAYSNDLKHPFDVATNHGTALLSLSELEKRWKFKGSSSPNWQGFIVKVDDYTYIYANRKESYEIAKAAHQLKPNTKALPYGLDSYQISRYDPDEIGRLHNIAINVAKAYADRYFRIIPAERITMESLKGGTV